MPCKEEKLNEDASLIGYYTVQSHRIRPTFRGVTASIIRVMDHLKRRDTSRRLHDCICQKAVIFVLAAART
jgi:hypothetical protein